MLNSVSPFVMVIFGVTGDLTSRKLMPALFAMYTEGFLPEKFYVVGVARREMSNDDFRAKMKENIKKYSRKKSISDARWDAFLSNFYYQRGYFEEEEGYRELSKMLVAFDKKAGTLLIRYFYLATPPQNYSVIIQGLHDSKLSEGYGQESNKWTRILIEKPFGRDAESARLLEEQLARTFEEKQIFRIDHYLGKEAIQNIIAFRFANGIFEPLWNKDYIDHVQITMAESGGLEGRIGFYEGVGAMRDVMQNHMLEMLALVAMEQPRSFSSTDVRNARGGAIKAIRPIVEEEVGKYVIRGQYGESMSSLRSVYSSAHVSNSPSSEDSGLKHGEPARRTHLPANSKSAIGYRQEKGVDPESMTETYVAMKVYVDTPKWEGVPWYLRTGKRLKKDGVEISIVFKQTCHILFREIGCPEEGNILTLRVSPHEGIGVRFIVKQPGHEFKLKDVDMDFNFKEVFSEDQVLEAYERILEDVFRADQMLFNRSDEMAGSWRIITPILKHWEDNPNTPLVTYTAGSWGPKEADKLIEKDGRKWILR